MVGATLPFETTRIGNPGNEVVFLPSDTVMVMPCHQPEADAVPDNLPVEVLNVAHAGLLATLKVSFCLSASAAEGWNEYCAPTYIHGEAEPEIVGAAAMAGALMAPSSRAAGAKAPSERGERKECMWTLRGKRKRLPNARVA